MKNNYLRYLSDKRFRDTVNQLTDTYTDLFDENDEYTSEDWRDAVNEALQFVLEGTSLLDDEKAAKHLPRYEEWLQHHPFGIDLTKESKTVQ